MENSIGFISFGLVLHLCVIVYSLVVCMRHLIIGFSARIVEEGKRRWQRLLNLMICVALWLLMVNPVLNCSDSFTNSLQIRTLYRILWLSLGDLSDFLKREWSYWALDALPVFSKLNPVRF